MGMLQATEGAGMRRRAQPISGSRWSGLLMLMLMMVLLAMGSVSTARTAHADSTGSMHVVVPAPSADNKTVAGPLRTNVSVSASQVTAGARYSLGWANPSDGCANGFQGFESGDTSVTADNSGTFVATVIWPGTASDTTTQYLICARDIANPTTNVITCDQQYQVLVAGRPHFALAPVSKTKATGYSAGGAVRIDGVNFVPGNTPIDVFVTTSATFAAADFQPDLALKTQDGSPITSDAQGSFTATVLLPLSPTGQLFIYVVSADGVPNGPTPFPPSLVVNRAILIGEAQPTPSAQPSPTVAVSPNPKPHKSAFPDHPRRILAIVLLGVLSLILFIVGGVLIASVALKPRTPPTMNSGERATPDAVHTGRPW
jgi:hypothetical protein